MIHLKNSNSAPDSDFVSGSLDFIVPGNKARLLDPRRTPVRVQQVSLVTGHFSIEILDFEDKGAIWEIPYEDVGNYQFAGSSAIADGKMLARLSDAEHKFNKTINVPFNHSDRQQTEALIETEKKTLRKWLGQHSQFLRGKPAFDLEQRRGVSALYEDLKAYMELREIWDIEDKFATRYVSNPYAGEFIKAHRIVVAELGLCSYTGKVIRDDSVLTGDYSRMRRVAHIVVRVAFMREILPLLFASPPVTYRAISTDSRLVKASNRTFVSTTLSREVAESFFTSGGDLYTAALYRQPLPFERTFMSFVETEHMNRNYKEAEVVLLFEESNLAF